MKISVIIPVYNAEATIGKCVESILANKNQNLEIILIDDCSKDHSWSVCQRFADKYENIICIRNEKNSGVSYTRNQGLRIASGDYLMFVDSDDWVDATFFEEFRKVVDTHSVQLAVCGYVNHDESVNGVTQIFGWNAFEGVRKYDLQNVIKSLHENTLLQQLWNKIFDAKLIRDNNIWFDESISIGEDCRFILEYIKVNKIKEVALINKPLYHYIRGISGSLMYRVGYESVEEPLKELRTLYEIMGVSENEINKLMIEERQKQIEMYAYLIYHNAGMKEQEKKRLILGLDPVQGKELYKKNRILFYKERIAMEINRLKKCGK